MLLAAPAMAAERALLNIIGYSQDSAYFAFEEYGVGDGTGGYYDTIYVIDLNKDAWVKGAPYHFADETGDMKLADVRAKVMALAGPMLKSLKINSLAQILAMNGDGEKIDRHELIWFTPSCCGVDMMEDTQFTLTLTENPVDTADYGEDCTAYVERGELMGFTLAYTDGTDKSQLHSDGGQLPKSRGCPLGYGIYAVVQNFESGDGRVAILESWPFGFEGPDRRFIVVPIDGHI
jgi:predicted secreted protein